MSHLVPKQVLSWALVTSLRRRVWFFESALWWLTELMRTCVSGNAFVMVACSVALILFKILILKAGNFVNYSKKCVKLPLLTNACVGARHVHSLERFPHKLDWIKICLKLFPSHSHELKLFWQVFEHKKCLPLSYETDNMLARNLQHPTFFTIPPDFGPQGK